MRPDRTHALCLLSSESPQKTRETGGGVPGSGRSPQLIKQSFKHIYINYAYLSASAVIGHSFLTRCHAVSSGSDANARRLSSR